MNNVIIPQQRNLSIEITHESTSFHVGSVGIFYDRSHPLAVDRSIDVDIESIVDTIVE